jgi:Helix-turn-helix of DDE superfamily endonuclease
MASVRYADVASRPTEFLDFTSLTRAEFQLLLPPFEAAFQAHMAVWRFDRTPRTTRRFTVYKNCPLPTPEDRLFFLLTYLKTYALQVVHGRLFGMPQCKANQWIHVLLPVLLTALRSRGDAPTRSLAALAQRLGVTVREAAAVVTPREAEDALTGAAAVVPPLRDAPAPTAEGPVAAASASPLLPTTARSGGSSAPKTLLNRRTVIAARKKTTR